MKLDRPFLAFVVALIIGICFTAYCLFFLATKINWILYLVLAALLICGTLGSVIIIFRNKIIEYLGKRAEFTIDELSRPLKEGKDKLLKGELSTGIDNLIDGGIGIGTRIAWINYRKWMINVFAALFIGFGALIGSALIHNQNELIAEQNKNLLSQLELLRQDRYYTDYDRYMGMIRDENEDGRIRSDAFSRLNSLIYRNNIHDNLEALNITFPVDNHGQVFRNDYRRLEFTNTFAGQFDSVEVSLCLFEDFTGEFKNSQIGSSIFANFNHFEDYHNFLTLSKTQVSQSLFAGTCKVDTSDKSITIDKPTISVNDSTRIWNGTFIDYIINDCSVAVFEQCKFINVDFQNTSFDSITFDNCYFDFNTYTKLKDNPHILFTTYESESRGRNPMDIFVSDGFKAKGLAKYNDRIQFFPLLARNEDDSIPEVEFRVNEPIVKHEDDHTTVDLTSKKTILLREWLNNYRLKNWFVVNSK